ncbi:MAG: bifunctional diaminohydroxyphosphoribosylaminopyrimidine deaminase/5-amino-6-(5-phosphoribosylamino)uracil reductase RibD [Candidatus Dormibacteraeota bacterium]|uniref:Riboflavin biosynthesis protein RibD n=1 Tax=Candidatus Amunia macphersoniae TaxID=3127014 RepID=A0A934KP07_9BACT|nr:bifunctional diaminohydroxyphosphoribosylaminopyrimidine deaminase/5-amino-6-(5-phosphoribosylamino)uracil reductase RibD [Candidatus Dormibacteraeota bacterium]
MAHDDRALMTLALAHAAAADFATSPNPMVGAVVARDGAVLAAGHHARAGEAHAEVNALEAAGDAARGSDLFITLEPCSVRGRTPPCVDAVIAAAPRRVVVAMLDPNPQVSGRGVAAVEAAGIPVEVGLGAAEAERLNRFYLTHARTGLPFVTAKFAASLDGRIATRGGQSRWITSAASREMAHHLRRRHDAVLVGATTVITDDPQLTVRLDGQPRQPVRVVVDSTLRIPPTARLFEPGAPVMIATTSAATADRLESLRAAGAEVLVLPAVADRVDLRALLRTLGERNLISVIAEGGSALLGALFDMRAVDALVAFLAPRLIGGVSAPAAIGGAGAATLAESIHLSDLEVERVGGDLVVTGYCVR